MSEQPLSAYNVFHELQQNICDIMNKSQVLKDAKIEFIAENRLDIDYQIKESLKKQGLAAVVMTPNATYLGHNGTSEAYQLDDLTIQFVEYTPINRAKNKASVVTGLDLANYTSEILGGPNSVIGFGKLCPKGIEQGEDGGLLVTKLTFRTYIENGDTGPIIYVPFVTKEEMEQYVGDGKLTFTKNGQTIGQFTANQKNDLSIELPNDGGIWGSIEGNIENQADLIGKLNEKAGKSQVDGIEAKIPNAATSENQLADKAFVNSSINNYSAFYLTKNANGDAFETHGEMLLTGKFWNAGVERIPTKNDYLIVLQDETKTTAIGVNPTTRYVYQGEWPTGQFEFQYIVNNTALTQAQVDAINSGITKSIVDSRVIPSTTHPGYAANADNADNAATASMAELAVNAENANFAQNAEFANSSSYAQAAEAANTALSANYALDVKPFDASKITSGTLVSARLPLATSSAQGAVKPVAKTAEMTQDVGVDSSGRLYTAPATGGVTKIVAGSNVTISPASGTGEVTINASGGGGGGGDIPADLSCNHLSVGTSVSLGLGSVASGEYGSIAQGSYSKSTANSAVALGSECSATAQMSYAIGHKAEARHKNSMVLALTDTDNLVRQSNGDNSLNIYVSKGQVSQDALNYIFVNGLTMRRHIDEIIQSIPDQQQLYFYPFDPVSGHSQEGTNINIGNGSVYYDNGIICFILKFGSNAPFILEWQDPVTYNIVQEQLRLFNSDSSQEEVTHLFVVPCTFSHGVNIYNDVGQYMKVDELFKIEIQFAYSI